MTERYDGLVLDPDTIEVFRLTEINGRALTARLMAGAQSVDLPAIAAARDLRAALDELLWAMDLRCAAEVADNPRPLLG